jgi:SAM-dependent methyltransferase
MNDREKWDARYSKHDLGLSAEPSEFLQSNRNLLPPGGLALDLASGEGRNSIFLAARGFQVIALDMSIRALQTCRGIALERNLQVGAAAVDLTEFSIPQKMFDVVIVFNYLQRGLAPAIIEGLKPGGVLVYETLTIDHLKWRADFNPEFLLNRGELARLFRGLRLLKYRETVLAGKEHKRAVASLIAKKG